MIIVEGPDGAGKSGLVRRLSRDLQLEVAPRASDSVEGPVKNLRQWAFADVNSWTSKPWPLLYDRHPLVSEYIYGPVCRGEVAEGLTHPTMFPLRQKFSRLSLLVLCLPPYEEVVENVHRNSDKQMPGVVEHIGQIWGLYDSWIKNWNGNMVLYDYTAVPSELSIKGTYSSVIRACRIHAAQWNRNMK